MWPIVMLAECQIVSIIFTVILVVPVVLSADHAYQPALSIADGLNTEIGGHTCDQISQTIDGHQWRYNPHVMRL